MKKFIIAFACITSLPLAIRADEQNWIPKEIREKVQQKLNQHPDITMAQARSIVFREVIDYCEKQNGNYENEETKKACEGAFAIQTGLIKDVINELTKLAQ